MHNANEVSEVRLVGEIDDERDEVIDDELDEDSEVCQTDEWWLMTDDLDKVSKVEESYSTESEIDELR